MNELPKYMVRDRPELVPHPEQCAEDKYFEVIKTKVCLFTYKILFTICQPFVYISVFGYLYRMLIIVISVPLSPLNNLDITSKIFEIIIIFKFLHKKMKIF